MSLKEILLEEDFHSIQKEGIGYIAITDGSKCRIHHVQCSNVDYYYFRTKVIENNRKNGSYYWAPSLNNLRARWKDSDDCLHCKHL
ncbi:hypothetical protein C0966_06760 [Bacillus methanolicus]|uniref:hypothetical protein n=1 Tax=Bacillus methanolicus TaxID=1471 RepID=UPI0023809568|nr:hypothetical protein [Bacillus methanolicus]MDE3839069.1 hypothetical protein [Bacillus methanolicus]